MSTGAILIISLLVPPAVWAVVETKTLRDKTPDNHITAVVRAAVKAQPGPFIWLAFSLGFLSGHLFWW